MQTVLHTDMVMLFQFYLLTEATDTDVRMQYYNTCINVKWAMRGLLKIIKIKVQ